MIYNNSITNINPIIFITSPIRTMSLILIKPDPKTMAFGGVATGSINAVEHEIVTGNINTRGFRLSAIARLAIIGNIVDAIAVFEVNSVVNVVVAQIAIIINSNGKFWRLLN